ncbi:serine protease [Brevibacillus sp. SYSU BS000544]|uniref:serine protease n=1 Tax=Brevibacillus sp. SYSU BS000544 TaxID=3416443 RepID=UPI003CE4C741
MNYFMLTQDLRNPDAVEPVGVSQLLDQERQDRHSAEEIVQIPVRKKGNQDFIDFIQCPQPLLSDRLKQTMIKFEPRIKLRPLTLIDQSGGRQKTYWHMTPPKVNCLSERTEFHKDGSLKRLLIEEEKAARHRILQIDGIREPIVLVNLELAESLLRREFTGIRLTKVEKETNQKEILYASKGR